MHPRIVCDRSGILTGHTCETWSPRSLYLQALSVRNVGVQLAFARPGEPVVPGGDVQCGRAVDGGDDEVGDLLYPHSRLELALRISPLPARRPEGRRTA